jgi:hypothetical protein
VSCSEFGSAIGIGIIGDRDAMANRIGVRFDSIAKPKRDREQPSDPR